MKWIFYFIFISLASSSLFCSQSLAKIPNPLKWAADTESGAPFAMITNDSKNPLIGFEVEIIQAISEELGVKLEFVQNAWDGLIPGLKNNNYDLAINGIEITPDRQAEVSFSRPYYSTFEQLVVRSNQEGIESLGDCKKKKVGTLKFSLAQRILEAEGDIEVLTYESEVAAYSDLKNKRTDAVLLDSPIAIYYAKPDMELKLVGSPIGQILYGIAINKENKELGKAVDKALKKISENGKLREILDRWNLWSPVMASYLNDQLPSRTPPVAYQEFLQRNSGEKTITVKLKQYYNFLPALLRGALMTLKVSLAGMFIAIILGFILAVMKIYGSSFISWTATFYIEIIRGTPLLIQLFFIFYGLPYLGIKFSPFVAGILGLGLNYAAYEAENYRAGIFSVPKAQVEAAIALGMNQRQALFHVILPQAFRIALPPMTNDFISLLKDSSLVSAITMVELTKVYGQLASTYYDYFGTGILVASIYLFLGLPFIRIARYFERKLNVELKEKKMIG
ncbi:MAG: ABC transporter substrate-binding protein/permease [Bacteriovorax sp.]|nr:ABC transporter substrate-binding protein/permease [Bacteriovorax sp.]